MIRILIIIFRFNRFVNKTIKKFDKLYSKSTNDEIKIKILEIQKEFVEDMKDLSYMLKNSPSFNIDKVEKEVNNFINKYQEITV